MLSAVRVAAEAVIGVDASGAAVFGDGTITWPIAQVLENAEVGRQRVTPPPVAKHVYHQYTIRVACDRDRLAKAPREEHETFRSAVLGRTVDVVKMRQGLAIMAVAEAVLKSAATGTTVLVP